MTNSVEITYLYDDFSLRVNENIMNRAVRIKTAVKDKIKRVFDKNEGTKVQENTVEKKESLIDLTNLSHINDILNYLEGNKVTLTTNRAVLFTQALVSKINRVSSKWFEGMERVVPTKNEVEMPSVDMINHLGGEVVPSTWDDSLENDENVTLEPTLEQVPTIEPTVEQETEPVMPSFEIPTISQEEQNIEPEGLPTVEPQEENVVLPTINENTDIYKFPSFEYNFDTNTEENSATAFDFVSEPTQINASLEDKEEKSNDEVSEPKLETNNDLEDKIGNLISKEVTPKQECVSETVDERSAEDKIDSLLGKATDEEKTVETADKPTITQAQILARLQRVNNTMTEKDTTIKSLTAKNESLKDELNMSKEKNSEYEAKVSDLTTKNSELSKENERLSSKLEESEANSKGTISKLEAKLDEVTQSKSDEIDSLKKMLEELKEKHASEISSMKESHAAELKRVNETKDKQIQAIYSTISEALGESNLTEDNGRSMAA